MRRIYYSHTLFGVTVTAVLVFTERWAVWLLSPVLLCWMLTVPLALAFTSPGIGVLMRRAEILLTPEENAPPPIVARSQHLAEIIRNELPDQAWRAALTQGTAIAVHRAFLAHAAPLSSDERNAAASAAEKYRADTSRAGGRIELTDAEKTALLRDPERVWDTPTSPTLSIYFPLAAPTLMPEQQLTRRASSFSELAHIIED
jgi:membrane glycosyltransferase